MRVSLSIIVPVCAALAGGCGGQLDRRSAPAVTTAAAGAPAVPPGPGACGAAALPPARVWRLTHAQLRNSLQDLFGYAGPAIDVLPADARLDGFANGASRLAVPPVLLDYYRKVSDEVSSDVVRRSSDLLPCRLTAPGGPCLRQLLTTLGLRAWRRPLVASELGRLEQLYRQAAGSDDAGAELGLKSLIEALILSPNFLFRYELGDNQVAGTVTHLTDWEIASALSYTLWDAPPDAPLLALAAAGRLRDPANLEAQARRLLGTPGRAAPALTYFFRQWMKIEDLPTLGKDAIQFPIYTPGPRPIMSWNRCATWKRAWARWPTTFRGPPPAGGCRRRPTPPASWPGSRTCRT